MNGSGEFGILDKQIDVLRTGGILPEKDILSLCTKVGCARKGAGGGGAVCWGGRLLLILFLDEYFANQVHPSL